MTKQLIQASQKPLLSQQHGYSYFANLLMDLDISTATFMDYSSRLEKFVQFALSYDVVPINIFLEYKRHLQADTSLSVSSKNKYLTVARLVLREGWRRGAWKTDITAGVKGFRQSKKHKKYGINDADMAKLKEWIEFRERNKPLRYQLTPFIRIKSLIMLLAYQGLRQIEIVRLDIADFSAVDGTLLVRGKGSDDKERIYLHPEVVSALNEYVALSNKKSGAMFYSLSNSSVGSRLTTRGLRSIVSKVLERLGIEASVHGFRHYFVTKLLKEMNGDVMTVMRYSRHKSLDMLQVYNDAVVEKDDLPRFNEVFAGTL